MNRPLLLLLLFPAILYSQNESSLPDSIKHLQGVDITAAYEVRTLSPFSFSSLENEQMDRLSYGQEPSFVLSQTPSMTAYSDAGSFQGYSYFRLRGIDQTRINMTLDGVPLNEPEDQGVYFSNYPDVFNSLDRLQIQRGIGSTQNGSASYAGSIQLISPNLLDSAYRELGLDYGSFHSYRMYGELNTGLTKGFAAYVRVSQLHSDGYTYRSANDSQSAFYSLGYFQTRQSWKLTGFIGRQQNQLAWLGVPEAQLEVDPRSNANAKEDDDFSQSLTQLQHSIQLRPQLSLRSSLYYNQLRGNYDFDFNNFLGLPSTEELYNYAFVSHFSGGFSHANWRYGSGELTGGIHLNHYQRQHLGSEKSLGELYVNTGFKREGSAFVKWQHHWQAWHLLADVQARTVDFRYEGAVDMPQLNWAFLNPKIGLSYEFAPQTAAYYSLGQTGREPTRNDLFLGNDDLVADSLGQPMLGISEAEYVLDHELGIRWRKREWTGSANLFFMSFRNEILLNGQFGPNGLALTNQVDRSFRSGLEVSVAGKWADHWFSQTNASLIYSRITESDQSFSPILTPPILVNQHFSYRRNRWEVGGDLRYQAASWLDFANEAALEDFFLLNVQASHAWQGMVWTLRLNNLLNNRYFVNGYLEADGSRSLFVQTPFHAMASVRWRL